MRFKSLCSTLLFLLLACNRVENHDTLDEKDIEYIKSLQILEEGETIHQFYSEYKRKVAGNYFTDRRIASYWIDDRNSEKNRVSFAYYADIVKIDTVYYAGLTYTPFLRVTKNDSTKFKVSVDGTRQEVKEFFEGVLKEWKKKRN
jgi:hypothetical protein